MRAILEIIFDWILHWRRNVCFWGSVILATLAAGSIPSEPLRWIVAGFIVVAGLVISIRWEWNSGD
jgi:hypothetical protein